MAQIQTMPLKMLPTRVWRTYTGGARLEQWLYGQPGHGGHFPENWIASTVQAVNPGHETIGEGLTHVENMAGQPELRAVLQQAPEAWLGQAHAARFGATLGVLMKLIDAGERLTIQVHPDKAYAADVLHSSYGKTESWYILEASPEACVYLGFRPGITREKWKQLFEAQDTEGMLNCLHRVSVQKGDVFFISGGLPHAIGKGCLLAEVQEPTDYTMRVERTTPAGLQISDQQCHQGVGFERMLDCFHYEGLSREETLHRWKPEPQWKLYGQAQAAHLIDEHQTRLFAMSSIKLQGSCQLPGTAQASVVTILEGEGLLRVKSMALPLHRGDSLLLPAGMQGALAEGKLHLLLCCPPRL